MSFVTCTADLVGQYGGQVTLANKVNGARDKANFDLFELVYPKKHGKQKKIIIFLASPNDWNRNGQYNGQATLTMRSTGAHGARVIFVILHLSTQRSKGWRNRRKQLFSTSSWWQFASWRQWRHEVIAWRQVKLMTQNMYNVLTQ